MPVDKDEHNNDSQSNNVHVRRRHSMPGWPELIDKLIESLIRIVEVEANLVRVTISNVVIGAVDHLLSRVAVAIVFLYGFVCLVCSAILFLHKWIDWWMASGAVGAFLILAAVCISALWSPKWNPKPRL